MLLVRQFLYPEMARITAWKFLVVYWVSNQQSNLTEQFSQSIEYCYMIYICSWQCTHVCMHIYIYIYRFCVHTVCMAYAHARTFYNMLRTRVTIILYKHLCAYRVTIYDPTLEAYQTVTFSS